MTRDEFARAYAEQLPKIRSYIAARLPQSEEAEDLSSEVFTKAYAALDSFQAQKGEFSTWLYTIAGNTIRDHLRRGSVRARYLAPGEEEQMEAVADAAPWGEERLLRGELLEALAAGLQRLPELQRQVVVLQFYDCLPQREIAERLGLSYSNTRYLSHRAVKALQSDFQRQGLV